MAVNFLTVISRKSITVDEYILIPAGYYHLVAGNFQINNETPPLIKMLAAVPLFFIRPNAPPPPPRLSKNTIEHTRQTTSSFWRANGGRYEMISFWSRVPAVMLTLALGVLIFIYARRVFNPRAAVFAVILFSFEPTVLAHGRVVQTDMPAAITYLFFFFMLHAYASVPTTRRALALGLASGLALIAKFSMIVIGPILLIAGFVLILIAPRRGQRRTRLAAQLSAAALVALLVINAAYYFDSRPLGDLDVGYVASQVPSLSNVAILGLRAASKAVPADFLYGIFWQYVHNRAGHPASLLGMYGDNGWWYYFPVAFALKTTAPFLLLSVVALLWALRELFLKRKKYLLAFIVPVAIYTALVMTSRINIGVRYFLPALPFLFILGGAFLDWLIRHRRARVAGVALATLWLCWVCAESVGAYPHYMSYVNQLAWHHPSWHYLSDSNVEWGDDTRALAEYLRARGETKVRARFLGGSGRLEHYGVEYVDLLLTPEATLPETRYAAIGASYLNGSTVPPVEKDGVQITEEQRRNFFAEYRQQAPEAVFGNAIYLYRIRE